MVKESWQSWFEVNLLSSILLLKRDRWPHFFRTRNQTTLPSSTQLNPNQNTKTPTLRLPNLLDTQISLQPVHIPSRLASSLCCLTFSLSSRLLLSPLTSSPSPVCLLRLETLRLDNNPPQPSQTHTTIAMALKRINKELTDLGRYVFLLFTAAVCPASGATGKAGSFTGSSITSLWGSRCFKGDVVLTFFCSVVTHRRRALQALSEMIWYVLPFSFNARNQHATKAHETMRRSQINFRIYADETGSIVPLAGYHYGTRKFDLIQFPRSWCGIFRHQIDRWHMMQNHETNML